MLIAGSDDHGAAAAIGPFPVKHQVAVAIVADDQPVAGVGRVAMDRDLQRVNAQTVGGVGVRVLVRMPNSDQVVAGARLDTDKPGTGLGLAIVRDVAEIYGGTVEIDESEDLGGLLAKLTLPRAPDIVA